MRKYLYQLQGYDGSYVSRRYLKLSLFEPWTKRKKRKEIKRKKKRKLAQVLGPRIEKNLNAWVFRLRPNKWFRREYQLLGRMRMT